MFLTPFTSFNEYIAARNWKALADASLTVGLNPPCPLCYPPFGGLIETGNEVKHDILTNEISYTSNLVIIEQTNM